MKRRKTIVSTTLIVTSLIVGAFNACSGGGGGSSGAGAFKCDVAATWPELTKTFTYLKPAVVDADDLLGYGMAVSGDGQTLVVGAYNEASNAVGVNGDATNNSALGSGAAYVFVRSGNTWVQQAYLKASNTGSGDSFGYSVAISQDGNTVAIGATYEASNATGVGGDQSNNLVNAAGAVYIFTRASGVWSQQAYIKASNTDALDRFGWSVALSSSGDTLAVGAVGERSNAMGVNGNQADNSATNSGAVYVFTRASGGWSQQAYVKASNTDAQDQFGVSVALSDSGDDLVVAATYEDSSATGVNGDSTDNSAADSGAAYVYKRSGASWSQQAYLKASNSEAGDNYGFRVAISGDATRIAVGAFNEGSAAQGINGNQSDNSAPAAGAVYVYKKSAQWAQEAYLKASNNKMGDNFGSSVALLKDGSGLIVGALSQDSSGTGFNGTSDNAAASSGAIYAFYQSGGQWVERRYIKATNTGFSDLFGIEVAVDDCGSVIAASSNLDDSSATGIDGDGNDNSAHDAGSVHVIW